VPPPPRSQSSLSFEVVARESVGASARSLAACVGEEPCPELPRPGPADIAFLTVEPSPPPPLPPRSNDKKDWALARPMDCEERLVTQAQAVKAANPATKVFTYRNLVKVLRCTHVPTRDRCHCAFPAPCLPAVCAAIRVGTAVCVGLRRAGVPAEPAAPPHRFPTPANSPCTRQALPWFSTVREKLVDPAYAGWFLRFNPDNTSYHVPACDTNYNPPLCSVFYHDQVRVAGMGVGYGLGRSARRNGVRTMPAVQTDLRPHC
jgi:hypothetical protein